MKLCHHFYFGNYVRNHEFLTFDVGIGFEPEFYRSACFCVQVSQFKRQVRRSTFFCMIFAILVKVVIILEQWLLFAVTLSKRLKHGKTVSKHFLMC